MVLHYRPAHKDVIADTQSTFHPHLQILYLQICQLAKIYFQTPNQYPWPFCGHLLTCAQWWKLGAAQWTHPQLTLSKVMPCCLGLALTLLRSVECHIFWIFVLFAGSLLYIVPKHSAEVLSSVPKVKEVEKTHVLGTRPSGMSSGAVGCKFHVNESTLYTK